MEYTQEQLNTVAQCYQDEITRLLQVKVNKDLIILRLTQSNAEKDKQIAELNKVSENKKVKK